MILAASEPSGASITAAIVLASLTLATSITQGVVAHVKGRRGKRADAALVATVTATVTASVKAIVDEHEKVDVQRHGETSKGVEDVRHLLIGVDGENGVRGDVRELKEMVGGLLDRERERLEREVDAARHGRTSPLPRIMG